MRYRQVSREWEITCHSSFDYVCFRKLAKLGIVGGAVYVTVANGVWSKENDQVKSLVSQLRVAEAVNLQQVQSYRVRTGLKST